MYGESRSDEGEVFCPEGAVGEDSHAGWRGQREQVYHVYGDATNQDTLLCCRVWSALRAVRKSGARLRPHTSWFASWSPAHRSQSTDSMTTTPPTAHALQTPTDTHKHTIHGWGMAGKRKGWAAWEHPDAGELRKWEKREIFNESEHIPLMRRDGEDDFLTWEKKGKETEYEAVLTCRYMEENGR